MECENNQFCTKCQDGYTLRDGDAIIDGRRNRVCLKCPTDDGCETCTDSFCETCKNGFFLKPEKEKTVGNCYKCEAFQDGCLECDNAYSCKKCRAEGGYIFDPIDKRCKCNEKEGFEWNQDTLKCECEGASHNIEFSEEDSKIYRQQRWCTACNELFGACNGCESSPVYSYGSKQFKDRSTGGDHFIKCTNCKDGFYYDEGRKNCHPCFGKHDSACTRCNADQCDEC
jgi:hypothetical protein